MWNYITDDDKKAFSGSLTEKDVLDFYQEKRQSVIFDINFDYIDFDELIRNYYNGFSDEQNRFIVDIGETKYNLATKKEVNKFIESVKKVLGDKIGQSA